jgi:branched-chain amino acid transport system substrate-binding protein
MFRCNRPLVVAALATLLLAAAPANPASADPGVLTIYSSLPLRGASAPETRSIVNGANLALTEAGGRTGQFGIRYVSLDSSAPSGRSDAGRVRANATQAENDPASIGYIGEFNSVSSEVSIPMLNQLPLAQISPSNTYVGLTQGGPGAQPGIGEPDRYYPTGVRTYARLLPNDHVQGEALATLMHERRCHRAAVVHSGTVYGAGLATTLRSAAGRNHLAVTAVARMNPRAHDYRSLAAGIRRLAVSCVAFTGEIESNGLRLLRDVGSALPGAQLFGSDGVVVNVLADPRHGLPERVARRFYATLATLDTTAYPAAGRAFFARYTRTYRLRSPDPYAIYGYEAMKLLLDTIAAAGPNGGNRRAVISGLFATRNRPSVLGAYSIDANGDTTLRDYGAYRIRRGRFVYYRTIHAR